jgi:TonB family protein
VIVDQLKGGLVSLRGIREITAGLLLAIGLAMPTAVVGQEEVARKVKSQVPPVYPELARKMNISGTVKIQVTIAPNGIVKSVKLVGGHPLLANAAMDSVRKWRYEPAKEETTTVVEFHFQPNQ